jgi:N-acyl-D-amino-acid deacylase
MLFSLRLAALLCLFATFSGPLTAAEIPLTGPALPGMERADAVMRELMAKYGCPGAQLAVTRHGRLVLNHGYGFADQETHALVQPESRFRIASLSKLLTSAAIFTLVEQGKLDLDARALALLPELTPLPGAKPDPRLATITVRQLLQHTGGWDRGASGDPMFHPLETARATGTPAPAGPEAIIRFMLGKPLDFDPGTRYVYSNFGYNILGRIVEKLSGQPYGTYVQQHLLAPAGALHFALGRSLKGQRATGEVTYYGYAGLPSGRSVFPPFNAAVPEPYGGFNLEAMDSHGAWIATAADYERLIAALDGSRGIRLLSDASIAQLTARPAAPVSAGTPAYYGAGLQVRPVNGRSGTGANWWHGGALAGTCTYQVRLANGWSWAAFFNSRPKDGNALPNELDKAMNAALAASTPPARGDLFTTPAAAPAP